MKEIQKVLQKLLGEQKSAAAAYEQVQKHKVTPGTSWRLNYSYGMIKPIYQVKIFKSILSKEIL